MLEKFPKKAPILGPLDAKSWLIGKYPHAGKDWGQKEKGPTGWDGCVASLTQWTWVWANSRDSEGQESLSCCSPWGCRVGHIYVTEQQQQAVTTGLKKSIWFVLEILSCGRNLEFGFYCLVESCEITSICLLWPTKTGSFM